MSQNRSVGLVGRYASVAVAVETVLFAASLIVGLTVNSSFGPVMGYIVCMLLAAGVVALMASFYLHVQGDRKIFSLLALVASVLYAPFCVGNYYVQLAIVATNPLNHPSELLKLIAFVPGSAAFALDMLGYTFLCLSTLAAAFALTDPRDRILRLLCLIHGVIAIPTVAAPILSTAFRSSSGMANETGSWVLLFWCALFTPIAILFSRTFRESSAGGDSEAP